MLISDVVAFFALNDLLAMIRAGRAFSASALPRADVWHGRWRAFGVRMAGS